MTIFYHALFELNDQDPEDQEEQEPTFEDSVVSFLCGIVFISGYALLTNKII